MFVGLDLGTSRFRAIGFDASGRRVASADAATQIRYGRDGSVTIDPHEAWRTARNLLLAISSEAMPRAIGVCAQLAILGIGVSGRPTTPAILWSDQRARSEAEAIAEALGNQAYALSRRPIVAELPAAKIRSLAVRRPSVARRTRSWISLKDYVVLRLTGEVMTDPTHASYTGLYDVAARAWSPRLADAAHADIGALPPVRDGVACAGGVSRTASAVTGVPAGTPVAVGAPDGTAGAIGAGAVKAGITVDVAGSTDVLFRTLRAAGPPGDGRLIVNAFPVPGLWAAGGPTGLSGGAISWLARLLGYESAASLRDHLKAQDLLTRSSDGLAFRTEFTGARFPDWRRGAHGVISGIRPEHQVGHLVRAAEEGAVFLVGAGLDEIERATGRLTDVIVVGGASRDPDGLELRATAWNRIVRTVREPEASALGAAMLASVAAGGAGSLQQAANAMIAPAAAYRPDRHATAGLSSAREAWKRAGGDE
jgi:xylulokinase